MEKLKLRLFTYEKIDPKTNSVYIGSVNVAAIPKVTVGTVTAGLEVRINSEITSFCRGISSWRLNNVSPEACFGRYKTIMFTEAQVRTLVKRNSVLDLYPENNCSSFWVDRTTFGRSVREDLS